MLERGQVKALPSHIDYPFTDGNQLFARVVYPKKIDEPEAPIVDPQAAVEDGLGAFLKVFDDIDIKKKQHVVIQRPPKQVPNILLIDQSEFNQRITLHEANRIKHQKMKDLLDKSAV